MRRSWRSRKAFGDAQPELCARRRRPSPQAGRAFGYAWRPPCAGQALVEFAVAVPVMLMLFHMTWAMVMISGFRLQVALVAHAMMREAAAGTEDPRLLTALANAYAKEVGIPRRAVITVTVGEEDAEAAFGGMLAGMFAGTRVNVAAWMPATGPLKFFFPLGVRVRHSSSVVSDPWKSPMSRFKNMLTGKKETPI